ncbi:MAG: hypothetical protein WCO45_07750 [Pseudanabaena sp. ELA607]
MKSYSAYFVRDQAMAKAQQIFGQKVKPLPDTSWLLCAFDPDDEVPDEAILLGEESLTEAKSMELGEIFFVYGDTSVDWFVYEHAIDGKLLRKLVWYTTDDDWNCGWLLAEGEPEAWEAQLFRTDCLTQYLENETQRLKDEGKSEVVASMEAEVRQIWERKQIIAGQSLPLCDGTVAMLVEKNYGINRFNL